MAKRFTDEEILTALLNEGSMRAARADTRAGGYPSIIIGESRFGSAVSHGDIRGRAPANNGSG